VIDGKGPLLKAGFHNLLFVRRYYTHPLKRKSHKSVGPRAPAKTSENAERPDEPRTSAWLKWLTGTLIALIAAGGGATAWLKYAEEKGYWPYSQHVVSGAVGTWAGSFDKAGATSSGTPVVEKARITVQFYPDGIVDLRWASTDYVDRGRWSIENGVITTSGEKSDFVATVAGNVLRGRFSKFGKESFVLTRQ
jgi:hypothetical protein